MENRNELGNAMAIMSFFMMTARETRAEIARLSNDEKADLGNLCRDALKAEEIGVVVAEITKGS